MIWLGRIMLSLHWHQLLGAAVAPSDSLHCPRVEKEQCLPTACHATLHMRMQVQIAGALPAIVCQRIPSSSLDHPPQPLVKYDKYTQRNNKVVLLCLDSLGPLHALVTNR